MDLQEYGQKIFTESRYDDVLIESIRRKGYDAEIFDIVQEYPA